MQIDAQIISAAIAVAGTFGGALVGVLVQRDAKKMAALERRVQRYQHEIRARQAEEDVAAEWLSELGAGNSVLAAKRMLRDRTEERRGLRPGIGPSGVRGG